MGIGNGETTLLWTKKWIPGHNALEQEEFEVYESNKNDVVACLVDELTGTVANRWIWEHERDGKFSVKTCYHFIVDKMRSNHAESSNMQGPQSLWKALWKMAMPNKIKIFDWRACKDGLPTKENLMKKQVVTEGHCDFCSHPREDLNHRKDQDMLALFFSLAWGLWYKRNKMAYDNIVINPKQPPPTDVLKLNTDEAMFDDLRRAGVGFLLQDAKGELIVVASRAEFDVENPKAIELLVVFRGIQFCASRGISNLQVESDSLLVVESLRQYV
ncbi:uncharacterized protein LOC121255205 [Juglans microcarpa x Juglans regia]|uniref:uncharacterized protein LOC121255205 n=1 Tax=Juglans microcarpa x Juglans regia TaxID=2249226 RepID=UPI001B7DDEC3|nr:uncharacterized protein LOC121255205 [Juglans microcarpa x Juglans regia]